MLLGDSLTGPCGGTFLPSACNGMAPQGLIWRWPQMGEEGPTQSGEWCCHLDCGKGPVAARAVEGGVYKADSYSGGDTPGGMLNRVDIGAFPSNRWYGVIIMPWLLWGLALRAAPQVVREGEAVLSLLLNGLCLQMLDVFGIGLLGWVGFGSAAWLCLPDGCGAALLCIC